MPDSIKAIVEFLLSKGFKEFKPVNQSTRAFQLRIDDGDNYLCKCNDKLFMNVYVWTMDVQGVNHSSVSMEIVAEDPVSQWFELTCYGIKVEDFEAQFSNNYTKLFTAWKAIYDVGKS